MDLRRSFRKAVQETLKGDAYLKSLSGGDVQVTYRPTRKVGTFTAEKRVAITFFDAATRDDETVPLWSRALQVDVWSTGGLDLAEKVAARVGLLIAGSENPAATPQAPSPLTLQQDPGAPGIIAHVHWESIIDSWEQDGDLDRITLSFRALVYQYPEGDR